MAVVDTGDFEGLGALKTGRAARRTVLVGVCQWIGEGAVTGRRRAQVPEEWARSKRDVVTSARMSEGGGRQFVEWC